jgi:hypothetical protein
MFAAGHYLLFFLTLAGYYSVLNKEPKSIDEAVYHVINYTETCRYPRSVDDDKYYNRQKKQTRQIHNNNPPTSHHPEDPRKMLSANLPVLLLCPSEESLCHITFSTLLNTLAHFRCASGAYDKILTTNNGQQQTSSNRKIEPDNIVTKKSDLQELLSEMIGRNHLSMQQRGGHIETQANKLIL